MEVKMNKEIRNYQESMFMGTEPATVHLFPVCHSCGGRDLFWSGRLCRAGNDRVAVYLRRCSVRSLWVLPVPWHECGAVCLGVYQVRIFIPQAIAVSKRGSVPCLYGRDAGLGRKVQRGWHSPYEKKRTAGKEKTDEAEKEVRKEWCV